MQHQSNSLDGFQPTEVGTDERLRNLALNSSLKNIYPRLEQRASDDSFFLAPQQLQLSPAGQNNDDYRTESPEAFFRARCGSSKEEKIKQLVNVVRAFSTGEAFSNILCKCLSGWSHIFLFKSEEGLGDESIPKTEFEAGVAHRLRQLEQARHHIRDYGDTRLWLVCLAHEIEYISQWKNIYLHTDRGVDAKSAAITMAAKYLKTAKSDFKRSRNIVQIMKEGGPAYLTENARFPQSKWEKAMTLDDITQLFAYKRENCPDLDEWVRWHNPEVSYAVVACFLKYGWSFSEFLDSKTQVVLLLKPHLQPKRPHADDWPRGSKSQYKRQRVDRSGTSALHNLRFSPPSSNVDPESSSGIYNTVESIPGLDCSHIISFDARNGTRDLTDPATVGNLGYAVNNPNILTDPATINKLNYAVRADEIRDLATADFLQSTDKQAMDILLNVESRRNQLADASTIQHLQWTVNEANELVDPSTDRFLQEATSATQLYLMKDLMHPSMARISTLPNARTGCLDPRSINNLSVRDECDLYVNCPFRSV